MNMNIMALAGGDVTSFTGWIQLRPRPLAGNELYDATCVLRGTLIMVT